MSLENAPKHVKLAVDLIEILENNEIEPATAVAALELVMADYQHKLQAQKNPT